MRDADPQTAELREALSRHAFQRGTFTLASGRESDFFIDCKRYVLSARGHVLTGMVLASATYAIERDRDARFDAIAGVALGGCSLASSLAFASSLRGAPRDAIFVRKAAKEHGSKRAIEGAHNLKDGATLLLVEDTITTGGSSLRAIDALRAAGFAVPTVLTLVDRLEGAREALEGAGVQLHAVYTRGDFMSS